MRNVVLFFRRWKWVFGNGLWHWSQLIFSTAVFLLVFFLAFNYFRPCGFPCWRLWCPHRNYLVLHSVDTLNVSILAFVTPNINQDLRAVSPPLLKTEEKQSCYSVPKCAAPAVDLNCSGCRTERRLGIWVGCSCQVLCFLVLSGTGPQLQPLLVSWVHRGWSL